MTETSHFTTLKITIIFIPFLENSFKHGAIIDGCLQIAIAVKREKETLIFEVEIVALVGE